MKCRDLLAFPGFEEVPERKEFVCVLLDSLTNVLHRV